MNVTRIPGLAKQLYRTINCLRTRGVYCVVDAADWALYWVGNYITTYLKERRGISAFVINDPKGLRHQLIHFIDRYAYLDGTFRRLHSSNHVFLTWFHGDPADPNPEMQRLFALLPEAVVRVQKVVVPCGISRSILVQSGIPGTKIATIPLGVDLAHFFHADRVSRSRARANLGIPEDAICIGSFQKDGVGWADGNEPKLVKGPDILLEVIAALHNRYQNLVILLTGPSRGYVKRGLDTLGVPYIHQLLSHYHDIVPYYHALDLYIVTSRAEGGPKALLESWATGVPIATTRVGMCADLITHGVNGMLAEVEDTERLTSCAIELIEDAALRETCRRQALKDVRQYDWAVVAEQYYRQLYQPCLS